MKKISVFLFLTFSIFTVKAEEGMLIPTMLSAFESDMQAFGMKLTAQDIFDANNASIKDAIIHFGGGCTSEIVSDKGLLLTNHHCGFYQINSHSTLENNILKNGFWAANYSEELPNENLTGARMVNIVDVTEEVLKGSETLDGNELQQHIQTNIARIKAEAISNTHYEAEIKPFDFGNSYYLLVKEMFYDVRLVGTPPNGVGKFGGDTDNWMWPRHTGDFAAFRIYTDENNLPAPYSEDNRPYEPLHHLPISLKDKKEGDFTMVFGFPGLTEQHTISSALNYIINDLRPAQIRMRDASLAVINAGMRRSEATTLQYASKQARIANAWKKWIGQIDGLKRADAITVKNEYETNYTQQALTNPIWKENFGSVVNELNELASKKKKEDFAYNLFIEFAYVGAEFFKQARTLEKFISLSEAERKEQLEKYIKGAEGFYKNYDATIDQEIFNAQSELYVDYLDEKFLPSVLSKENLEKLSQTIYQKSILTDKDRYIEFLKSPNESTEIQLKEDPAFSLFLALEDIYERIIVPPLQLYVELENQLMKTYVKGKHEMYPDHKHWSDANSTLRVTYGKLEGSIPRDGMKYTPFTTFEGIIEKYNTGNEDYELPDRMLELYAQKDYRGYDQDGKLWICFTGSNHTTGGNSGSPVINADGYLMGLNFDRSWESTMSDFMFDPSRCRNITVDIRYVLWMIEVYGKAPHIVEEMTLIKE